MRHPSFAPPSISHSISLEKSWQANKKMTSKVYELSWRQRCWGFRWSRLEACGWYKYSPDAWPRNLNMQPLCIIPTQWLRPTKSSLLIINLRLASQAIILRMLLKGSANSRVTTSKAKPTTCSPIIRRLKKSMISFASTMPRKIRRYSKL